MKDTAITNETAEKKRKRRITAFKRELGQINFGSEVIVSDPCYEPGIWCSQRLQVKPGVWSASVLLRRYDPQYGPIVLSQSVRYQGYEDAVANEYIGKAMVDSGQLGMFDAEYYENSYGSEESTGLEWYLRVSKITLSKTAGTTDNAGVVSGSGAGDGAYGVYVGRNDDGEIIAIDVLF